MSGGMRLCRGNGLGTGINCKSLVAGSWKRVPYLTLTPLVVRVVVVTVR